MSRFLAKNVLLVLKLKFSLSSGSLELKVKFHAEMSFVFVPCPVDLFLELKRPFLDKMSLLSVFSCKLKAGIFPERFLCVLFLGLTCL